ncbi:MAG: diguanylate cyclase [Pseudomonadota bacterium]
MSNHNVPEELQTEIQAIRDQYKERLVSDKSKLTYLIDGLSLTNAYQRADEIHLILHSISGSAGTFGFDKISEEARRIDEKLKESVSQSEQDTVIKLISNDVTHFCHLLDGTGVDNASSSSQSPSTDKTPQKSNPSRSAHEGEVWLIEENEQLAAQFSKQLVNFKFKINTVTLQEALKLADKGGWPDATIIDMDGHPFNATADFKTLFTATEGAPKGLIMLSENDTFDQRIKAAKIRATSFLKKPVDLSELVSHLEAVVNEEKSAQPRVMLIDDDKELCSLMKLELESQGMKVSILHNVRNIVSELNEFRPELLLLDMEMPEYSGIDIALLVRQNVQFESLPIVYLSAERNLDKQTEALLFDADDFLVKPISNERLISSIRSRVQRARNLEQLISKDGLTGLLKHATIKEHADRELMRARRDESPISMVMLDIDYFKRVNDTYGHSTGDTVIASLAALLRHRFRQTDIVGRYGGEEFLVILPNTQEHEAVKIVDAIRIAFSEMQFLADNQTFCCTLSAGCVCSNDLPAQIDASELVEAADKALYASKKNGRNQVSTRQ